MSEIEDLLLQEIKYVRKRVDSLHKITAKQNENSAVMKSRLDQHIESHWKWICSMLILSGAIITVIVRIT